LSLNSAAEIAMAQEIQQSFERKSKPTLHTLEYAARSFCARALSGDYYDFLDISAGRMAFVLADISGKGLPAALLMASLRGSIIAQGPDAFDNLLGTLKRVHDLFCDSSPPDHFASLFLADYNERAGCLRYVNCGHVPPVLFRGDGEVERLGSTAPVIGMLKNWTGTVDEVALRPGDVLVMFTDGVIEAKNPAGDDFGYGRLIQIIRTRFSLKPASLAETVIQAVQVFSDFRRQDDVTVVVVRAR
jgi:sigma-B regulation protein RsbU (phosphoserine phosphatase)